MKSKLFIGLVFLLAACSEEEITPTQQLKKDIAKIDKYLADHGINDAIKDASGVRIDIHTLGTLGLPANSGNDLEVEYSGRLLSNEEEFDDGIAEGKLTDWIGGWQIALAMLPEGTAATIYIPSGWAYGTSGQGTIPGNAVLIFDVEILSVEPTTAQANQLLADIETIDNYLEANSITATVHDSGIRYVISNPSPGAKPTLYDQVKISIKGKPLTDGTQFLNVVGMPTDEFSSRVANYLQGIMVGLQQMNVGEKSTIYVPSGLAYGTQAFTNLPANSNVIFEIELLEIVE
jgi:FKBP-type peptidyl-prolyl cis-trans isomerase